MEESITTIEGLAILIQTTMASKEDIAAVRAEMATKKDLARLEQKVDDGFRYVNARLDIIREDISDLPEIRHRIKVLEDR